MFRCITELKGLIIDIDSFSNKSPNEWAIFFEEYKCVFLTSSDTTAHSISMRLGEEYVLLLSEFEMHFAPNISTHNRALKKLGLLSTEVAYVSHSTDFISNAMGFMTGTIWITSKVSYEDISSAADIVAPTIERVYEMLRDKTRGFLGELALFSKGSKKGTILQVPFSVDEKVFPLIALGRYYGYNHYMSQMHPYSSAIVLNKKRGKPYYGLFDREFASLYLAALNQVMQANDVYGICSVPPRVGNDNRFSVILNTIAAYTRIKNLDGLLSCKEPYELQKTLSRKGREDNVRGVFQVNQQLNRNTIVLIDDIASTGSTLRECARVLEQSGAERIIVIVLGVNQIRESYWSSVPVQVTCKTCGERMQLLVNSNTKEFFYRCFKCSSTKSFVTGRKEVIEMVNREVKITNDRFSF